MVAAVHQAHSLAAMTGRRLLPAVLRRTSHRTPAGFPVAPTVAAARLMRLPVAPTAVVTMIVRRELAALRRVVARAVADLAQAVLVASVAGTAAKATLNSRT